MRDFEKIYLDDISNNQLKVLTERALLGPQREILTKVDDFNRRYHADIGITKTFRWSPGIYDKVRRIYTESIGWQVPTRKISTFFNKIVDSKWRTDNMRRSLTEIDDSLFDMRQSNAQFQDNTHVVEEAYSTLAEKFKNDVDKVQSETITTELFMDKEDLSSDEPSIYILCKVNEGHLMNISIKPDNRDEPIKSLFNIPSPWPIEICFQIPLIPWINKLCSSKHPITSLRTGNYNYRDSSNSILGTGYVYGGRARYCNEANRSLLHPYIGRGGGPNTEWGYVCFGDFEGTFMTALLQQDLVSFSYHFNIWASNFIINQTHPMNQIRTMWHGNPEDFQQSIKILGQNEVNSCSYPGEVREQSLELNDVKDTYCNKMQCVSRDICRWFIERFEEDFQDKRIGYLSNISDISKDEVIELHNNCKSPMKRVQIIHDSLYLLKENDTKLFSFLLFYRDVKNTLYEHINKVIEVPFPFKPVTILHSFFALEDIFNNHFATDEEQFSDLRDGWKLTEALLDLLLESLEHSLEKHDATFQSLEIDFNTANNYFQWVKVKKPEHNIDLKKNTAVGHGPDWLPDDDGVWKKTPF